MPASPSSRVSRGLQVVLLALTVVAFPLGALASHDFADVPDSNPFHNDISALVDAGVTFGCGGGNYCPSANVTREQMAAFLNRLGALAPGKTPVVNATKLDGLDSSQLLRGDVAASGLASCSGATMTPVASNVGYATTGGGIYSTGGATGYRCEIVLPDGATITSFASAFFDAHASDEAICSLAWTDRYGDTGSVMASSGLTGAEPGWITLTDDSVVDATVDNASRTYSAACNVGGSGGALMLIRSVAVFYTVTGLPLP